VKGIFRNASSFRSNAAQFRLFVCGCLKGGGRLQSVDVMSEEAIFFPSLLTDLLDSATSNLGRMFLMNLIWTILIGFVAGLIAKAISPGTGPTGFFMTAALGIGGSVAATYIGQALGLYGEGNVAGFLMSIAGACLLLFLYRKFARKN
jgi:uncharacterized membrane protein YeaQ/YmgE (transglycosylase-associated protein family)